MMKLLLAAVVALTGTTAMAIDFGDEINGYNWKVNNKQAWNKKQGNSDYISFDQVLESNTTYTLLSSLAADQGGNPLYFTAEQWMKQADMLADNYTLAKAYAEMYFNWGQDQKSNAAKYKKWWLSRKKQVKNMEAKANNLIEHADDYADDYANGSTIAGMTAHINVTSEALSLQKLGQIGSVTVAGMTFQGNGLRIDSGHAGKLQDLVEDIAEASYENGFANGYKVGFEDGITFAATQIKESK